MTSDPIPARARPQLSPRARVQMDKITGKPMLLYPEGVLIMNPTGHAIVSLCTGQSTVAEIVGSLAARYGASEKRIGAEVLEYLERLRAHNLLEGLEAG